MKTHLASFDRRKEAEALSSFLTHNGVAANVEDERRLQRYWFLASRLAGVHVSVPSEQFEEARHVLEEKNGDKLLRQAVHCPVCASCRVEYPAMTRKNILPTLAAQVLTAFGIMHHEYYCEDCHHTWRPPAKH